MSVEQLLTPQEFSSTQNSAIIDDVRQALRLKAQFYQSLGLPPEQVSTPLSFEPWLERARYQRIMLTPPLSIQNQENFLSIFKQEAEVQMVTNLRERYYSGKSTTTFAIRGDKLCPSFLPNEDFEEVLQRGLEYRRQTGSRELIREEKEIEGFQMVQKIISDPQTPTRTRVVSCSPPGLTKDTAYPKRFVDIWELKEDAEGKRYTEVTRFTAGLDYEGYKKSVLKLDPDYFDDVKEQDSPDDAYFLSHPIELPPQEQIGSLEELYEAFFEPDHNAMKEVLFQELLQVCMPFIKTFIDRLCKDEIDWRSLAESFNAVLVRGDKLLEYKERNTLANNSLFLPLEEQVAYFGRQAVRTIGGGCGLSAGFAIGYGFRSLAEAFISSVGKFGFSFGNGVFEIDQYGSLQFECPKCGATNRRPKNKLLSNCQHCHADVRC